MRIVLYTFCYNEESFVKYTLMHYLQFCDKIIIYDNQSTDSTRDIINTFPNTEIRTYISDGLNDNLLRDIKNECWKEQRGKTDYVIVCDLDEILYNPDIKKFLSQNKEYTIFHNFGYQMVSLFYPTADLQITKMITIGVRDFSYDKTLIFKPDDIEMINYQPGAHVCYPVGNIKEYYGNDMKLLHYKLLGREEYIKRIQVLRARLSSTNWENKWGNVTAPNEYNLYFFDETNRIAYKVI